MHVLLLSIITILFTWGLINFCNDIKKVHKERIYTQNSPKFSQEQQLDPRGICDAVGNGLSGATFKATCHVGHTGSSLGSCDAGVDFGHLSQHIGHVFHH